MAPEEQQAGEAVLQLPVQVVGPADVNRLLRDIDDIEDVLHQASIRKAGVASTQFPRLSRLLSEFAESNKLNVLKTEDRAAAKEFLRTIKLQAPTIHISFAGDPSALFTGKLVRWLRANIHPQLLLHIGLQPDIAAGCVVRSRNKYFDFSLRKRFDDQRQLLIEKLEGAHE
jgi:F0F1-type ATP synthase delta subunit